MVLLDDLVRNSFGDIANSMSLQALTSNFTNQIMPNLQRAASGAASEVAEITAEASSSHKNETNFFSNFLAQSSQDSEITSENMQKRFSDLRRKGQMMQHHPTPDNVKTYVSDVRDFLSDLRDGAYSGQTKEGMFEKLDLVDEKLEQISQDFFKEQKNEMALVASLGELEGLLVDVFV